MRESRRVGRLGLFGLTILVLGLAPGCATMRRLAPSPDLRPCTDGFAATADGWMLAVRHFRPAVPDPGKDPVILCHGLGLNATFWTITEDHLPRQLAARGYHVFLFDNRGSGASYRKGPVGRVNKALRQTPLLEIGEGSWTMDDQIRYDVPAMIAYVCRVTGREQVNWVGHSLGGLLMFGFLETMPQRDRISNFVGMGSAAILADYPQTKMLNASRSLRGLLRIVSTGRMARPMMYARLPGLEGIDSLYFTAANVDRRTISRFYGYTLEAPSRSALKQLAPYLEFGRLVSADGAIDYASLLGTITTPTLLVAGDGDVMSDVASKQMTYDALGSRDKTLVRFGVLQGHAHDYGHCDLVWSRHAPREIFPFVADWLDQRQPGVALRSGSGSGSGRGGGLASPQRPVQPDLRPGLEVRPQRPHPRQRQKLRLRQP